MSAQCGFKFAAVVEKEELTFPSYIELQRESLPEMHFTRLSVWLCVCVGRKIKFEGMMMMM